MPALIAVNAEGRVLRDCKLIADAVRNHSPVRTRGPWLTPSRQPDLSLCACATALCWTMVSELRASAARSQAIPEANRDRLSGT